MNTGIGFPHRLRVTRDAAVIYDGKADVQDAGASIPRGMTGQPGKEAEATAFLADEEAGLAIEQYDEVQVYTPDGRVKLGEVSYLREMDGAVLLSLDEAGLRHTVVIRTEVVTREPGGRITRTWVSAPAVMGRLTPVGASEEVQADQPSSAGEYVLTLPSSVVVTEGQQAYVTGHEDDDPSKPVVWSRMVAITKVLLPTRSKDRRQSVLAVDLDINPNTP